MALHVLWQTCEVTLEEMNGSTCNLTHSDRMVTDPRWKPAEAEDCGGRGQKREEHADLSKLHQILCLPEDSAVQQILQAQLCLKCLKCLSVYFENGFRFYYQPFIVSDIIDC